MKNDDRMKIIERKLMERRKRFNISGVVYLLPLQKRKIFENNSVALRMLCYKWEDTNESEPDIKNKNKVGKKVNDF